MPIRIRDRSTADTISRPRLGGQSQARLTTAAPSFTEQLLTAREHLVNRDLDRLYQDVEDQGRRFLENPVPEELARYKQNVRDFISFIIRKGLKLKSAITARELHQVIDKVDEELLSLADAFLASEKPLLDLAAKVDNVNGMLLDLKA